jgi:hypothetical protein
MKGLAIATLFGLAAGVACATVASSGQLLKLTTVSLLWILLNRTVMGFAIGASGLKVHWAWNGVIMGLIVGSIFSYYIFLDLGQPRVALLIPFGNAFFGLLIEFFTTVVCKQPAFPRAHLMQRAAA